MLASLRLFFRLLPQALRMGRTACNHPRRRELRTVLLAELQEAGRADPPSLPESERSLAA